MWWSLVACTSAPVDSEPVATDPCDELPQGQVTLPADDGLHAEPIEWWYWTGHLTDDLGRQYGFEHTVFAIQEGTGSGSMTHLALTDVDAQVFTYDVLYSLAVPEGVENGFSFSSPRSTAVGGDGHDTLHQDMHGRVLDVELVSRKAPVLHHGDGYHDYEVGGYTWYYSRERMDANGTLLIDGEQRTVTGEGWFDHQWGELGGVTGAGWDWFAIQLDDDREIMLFLVRGGDEVVGGSFTNADCETEEIAPEDLEVTALGEWTSPHTGCTYPQGWTVRIGDLDLTVTPVMADQEVENEAITYWEGASTVTGDATGKAYVELAGWCD